MVVSEMGEQWSPNTLPASVAERETTSRSGQSVWAMGTTRGMRMPKVPQAVPVEKLRNPAMMKMRKGSMGPIMLPPVTRDSTNLGVWSRSWQTPLRPQASTSTRLAGSMAFMPSTRPCMNSARFIRRRGTYCTKATMSAPKDAQTREGEASQLPRAALKVW